MPTRKIKTYHQDGYVLPLVIITGMILIAGALLISERSFSGLMRLTRQKQGDEATEIAEAGASILINELNTQFPYLLTANCQVTNNSGTELLKDPRCTGWEDFEFGEYGGPKNACPGRSTKPSQIMGLLYQDVDNENGSYRLRNYEFLGDQIQGGTAIIQVQGLRFKGTNQSSDIAASAIIEQEITVVPKGCNETPYTGCWGYGLATNRVQLQLGDIIDENEMTASSNANVHCVTCDPPPGDQCNPWTSAGQIISATCSEIGSGIISGERSSGPLDLPDAPTWNIAEWGDPDPINITTANNPVFRHQRDNESKHPINGCFTELVDGKKRTHCRILSINLSGNNEIDLKPNDEHDIEGDIRFYIEGQQINLAGRTLANTGKFGQFSIFGGKATKYPYNLYACGSKQLNIAGGSEIHAFIHMPCFNINLSGGNETDQIKIVGSVISDQWNSTGDYARLVVPGNAGATVCKTYEVCSSRCSGEFAALGTKRLSPIQMN